MPVFCQVASFRSGEGPTQSRLGHLEATSLLAAADAGRQKVPCRIEVEPLALLVGVAALGARAAEPLAASDKSFRDGGSSVVATGPEPGAYYADVSTRGRKVHGARPLSRLVAEYLARDGGCTSPPDEVASFRRASTLRTAIEHAGTCTDWDGMRFSHQYRIPAPTLARFVRRLLGSEALLRLYGTFDYVHEIVQGCRERGIGSLTVYDVALRIGAKLGKLPTKVGYLSGDGTRLSRSLRDERSGPQGH